ncbi:MAG TPA: UDP binding domain-containing protein, partial [Bryobacteraceae bacterium]|nr:UDP binding domain-containing protein [Bryobacteraceae bacterium]
VQNALNDVGKPVKGSKIHIFGVSYKRDIDDVRESPALDVIHLLQKRGATVSYTDPHVSEIRLEDDKVLTENPTALQTADCVVIITDHSTFDYKKLLAEAALIVDTRNAMKGVDSPKVVRL